MKLSKELRLLLFLSAAFSLIAGCGVKKETQFSGSTMGTTYHVKVVSGYFTSVAHLQKKIEMCLAGINHSMSTFDKESEISRFNDITDTAELFSASKGFFAVMTTAEKIYRQSKGAWDGTVDPLVNLWGFGRNGANYEMPAETEIKARLAQVGFDNIELLPNQKLRKRNPAVKIDLASIAKGYGVDQLAALLFSNQMTDFLVEIGGEIYAAGKRKDGKKWRVGINEPRKDAPANAVYEVVEVENRGFATSGDYRNFIEIKGKRYSHVIDPRTGWPVDNSVVSVSILADDCTVADGLATAIMVMGPEEGIALLNSLDDVEGLVITATSDGGLREHASKGFGRYRIE